MDFRRRPSWWARWNIEPWLKADCSEGQLEGYLEGCQVSRSIDLSYGGPITLVRRLVRNTGIEVQDCHRPVETV